MAHARINILLIYALTYAAEFSIKRSSLSTEADALSCKQNSLSYYTKIYLKIKIF